jgi:hypothetical protein
LQRRRHNIGRCGTSWKSIDCDGFAVCIQCDVNFTHCRNYVLLRAVWRNKCDSVERHDLFNANLEFYSNRTAKCADVGRRNRRINVGCRDVECALE